MSYVVRAPRSTDARGMAVLRNLVWRTTYPGLVPQDLLDGLDDERSTQVWESRLDAVNSRGVDHNGATLRVVVDMDADSVVGFGEVRPAESGPTGLEVTMINLDPAHAGRGLGARLLGVLTAARDCHAWVVVGHRPAQDFFAAEGFVRTEETRRHPKFEAPEALMVRRDWSAPGY